MIKKIEIRDVASYDHEGCTFEDLAKVNFIYGGNGTGKTTISRLLGSRTPAEDYPKCWIEKHPYNEDTVVYNKDFRDKNLQENIPGVFTIGEESAATLKDLEEKRERRVELARKLRDIEKKKKTTEFNITWEQQQLTGTLWKKTAKVRTELINCLNESLPEKKFENKLIAIRKAGLEEKVLHLNDLKQRYETLFGEKNPVRIEPLEMPEGEFEHAKDITNNKVWKERAWGGDQIQLGKLVKDLKIEEWVKKGMALVNRYELNICPFCQGHTVDGFFVHQMDQYFDEYYWHHIRTMNALFDQYMLTLSEILDCLKEILRRNDIGSQAKKALNCELFETELQLLKEGLFYNADFMKAKIKEPETTAGFKKLDIIEAKLAGLIDAANAEIAKHNAVVDNLEAERTKLKEDVWRYMAMLTDDDIEAANNNIMNYRNELKKLKADEKKTKADYESTDNYIKRLEDKMGSVHPTIDSINQSLEEMGITGFRIQPSESHSNHYQIQREDGRLALHTLSEGEVTIITFLYFMQLVKGFETNVIENKPRIVVMDDPISSLDSNVMYEVSEKIRELINEVRDEKDGGNGIEQVIVLTHNKAFHRQLNDRQKRKDTCYWWLTKNEGVSKVRAFGCENPIRGEYETMWLELKDSYERGNYTVIPNLMRKIIESYFVGMGGINKRRLIPENFSGNAEEMAIVRSLAKWMDEGSHRAGDDLYMEDPVGMSEKYIKVFKHLFEKMGHGAHYKMMMHEEA